MTALKKPTTKYREADDGKFVSPKDAKSYLRTIVKKSGSRPKKVRKP